MCRVEREPDYAHNGLSRVVRQYLGSKIARREGIGFHFLNGSRRGPYSTPIRLIPSRFRGETIASASLLTLGLVASTYSSLKSLRSTIPSLVALLSCSSCTGGRCYFCAGVCRIICAPHIRVREDFGREVPVDLLCQEQGHERAQERGAAVTARCHALERGVDNSTGSPGRLLLRQQSSASRCGSRCSLRGRRHRTTPLPSRPEAIAPSPRLNFRKILFCSRRGIPAPWSRTAIASRVLLRATSTRTVRHSGEYLKALSSRFHCRPLRTPPSRGTRGVGLPGSSRDRVPPSGGRLGGGGLPRRLNRACP